MRKDIKETNGLYQIDEECRFWNVRTGKEVCKKGNIAQFSIKGFPKISRTKQSIYRDYFLDGKVKLPYTKEEKILSSRYSIIKRRCYVETDKEYKNYGGRGIKMCNEWLENRQSFIDYCTSNGFSPELSIDRIDNNGNYEPNNIRFVNSYVQNNNTRSNILIDDEGDILTLSMFCAKHSLNIKTVYRRLKKVYDNDTKKLYEGFLKGDLFRSIRKVTIVIKGEELSIKETAKKFNIPYEIVRSRYKRGVK